MNQEEVFGPVLTVTRFDDEAEALALANGTATASAPRCGRRTSAGALRVARALDFADVWVNSYYLRHAETPFGGRQRVGSAASSACRGIEEYVSWKRVCIDTRADPFHLKTWFEQGQDFRG